MFDNDGDTRVDCADRDCASTVPCGAPVPVSSAPGAALLVVALGLIGLAGVARRAAVLESARK